MRGASEDFEERDAGAPQLAMLAKLSRPGMGGQAEVDQRPVPQVFDLLPQKTSVAYRMAVRVLDDGGRAAHGSRRATGDEIPPAGAARVVRGTGGDHPPA